MFSLMLLTDYCDGLQYRTEPACWWRLLRMHCSRCWTLRTTTCLHTLAKSVCFVAVKKAVIWCHWLTVSVITATTTVQLITSVCCYYYVRCILSHSKALTKRDVLKIDALDQWCLQKLLGIKWYHQVRNDEVRRTTGQPRLSAIVQ